MFNPSDIVYSRRSLLTRGVQLLSVAGSLPLFLDHSAECMAAEFAGNPSGAGRPDDHVLVVVQLAGGNDGLNTLVPISNDDYYKARPRLAVAKDAALKLTDDWGVNPAATGFKKLYDSGDLGIVHAVAYPNANRSHFRATDIWNTAEPERLGTTGWLGRYCDASCSGSDPGKATQDPGMAIAFDSEPPPALQGAKYLPLTFGGGGRGGGGGRPSMMQRPGGDQPMAQNGQSDPVADVLKAAHITPAAQKQEFLQRTALNAKLYAEKIARATASTPNKAAYPQTQLASDLKLVAQLIASGMKTRIYYVKMGGYDTHANQLTSHPALLSQLTNGIAAFVDDLKKLGQYDRVTLMTFSEFGRRVHDNGSGTDHGEAAPMFLTGGKIKAGFHGTFPGLAPEKLSRGDVAFTTDFRSVYATLLNGWLGADDKTILGGSFSPVDLIKA